MDGPESDEQSSFARARYCRQAPGWRAVEGAACPVFLAPPRLRPAVRRAVARAVLSPRTISAATRAGGDARSILRFLVWRDTVRCLGIEELVSEGDRVVEAFGRHLPPPGHAPERPLPTVAGLVLARNEEALLPRALGSLGQIVDEVVVVDDESTDGTAEVAQAAGAQVVRRALRNDFAAQRNAGVERVRSEWIVQLDADEVLEPTIVPLIQRAIRWGRVDAVFVPLLNRIIERGDEPVRWPDLQPRVFRARLRYTGSLHERIDDWRTAVFLPLSGPYIVHEKDLLRQHRATLLYNRIDPSLYPRGHIATVEGELAELERKQQESR